MKKYENKKGRIKDYLKGIISIAVGVVLIIIGIIWVEILPLAIVLWVLGCSAVVTGIGLIIHNKKNNTIYAGGSSSESSPSSGSSQNSSGDWEYKFKSAIEDAHVCAYSCSCYCTMEKGVIEVQAEVDVSDNENETLYNYENAARDVKSVYKKVAKNCPYPSRLTVKRR